VLNCGSKAGSCHGGDALPTYSWIKQTGGVPFDTCLQYESCSSESTEGSCKGRDFTCSAVNKCRTCNTFSDMGGKCVSIDKYPNVTIAEFGRTPNNVNAIKAEIFHRGPVAAAINAEPMVNYKGGIYSDADESKELNHAISIVGWGFDDATS